MRKSVVLLATCVALFGSPDANAQKPSSRAAMRVSRGSSFNVRTTIGSPVNATRPDKPSPSRR